MQDLISKLSEIRSGYNCFDEDEEPYYRALSEAIRILSKRADGDTISRADAIDAVISLCDDRDSDYCGSCRVNYPGEKDARKVLKDLPSAQTESCEYYALCRHGRDENKLRVRLGFCEYCNEDSNGYVKPIEKNNHAFVRFGTNGWELSLKANGWHGSAKIRFCPMCGRDLYVK